MDILRAAAVSAIMLLNGFTAIVASGQSCLSYSSEVELNGTLSVEVHPGPPNYESIEGGDRREEALILTLVSPFCVDDDPVYPENTAESAVGQLHLVVTDWEGVSDVVGSRVRVRGELFHAISGHHRRRVLMLVESIERSP